MLFIVYELISSMITTFNVIEIASVCYKCQNLPYMTGYA